MAGEASIKYREDIDGLRAIAVSAVILFHLGYLPNGYLGVDVFFVISGYLITKIVYKEAIESRFSIIQFYLRRIRRIIPLVLFTSVVTMIAGAWVMLPDDLENLSQSVVATNIFGNNILLRITTGDYWSVLNEYKPLMHTWSLGVEEQFYLVFPVIFLLFKHDRIKWIKPTLIAITLISLGMFFCSHDESSKFYLIPYRFFELSIGGLGAIYANGQLRSEKTKITLIVTLLGLLLFSMNLSHNCRLLAVVTVSLGILVVAGNSTCASARILENKLMVSAGKISFSLYMWHQIVLAFTRYAITPEYHYMGASLILVVVVILSVLSYYFIEQPFRDKRRFKTTGLLWSTGSVFVLVSTFSLYVYSKAGVLNDVPELEITKANVQRGMHAKYNSRVYEYDKEFNSNGKIKVLVIGNSFARDWANVLMESRWANDIEISYIEDYSTSNNFETRFREAQYVFFSELHKSQFDQLITRLSFDPRKVWNVGTKSFGFNNGIFYNRKGAADYGSQRTKMVPAFLELNKTLKAEWGSKYIDLIEMVADADETVPVFTPDQKFISQDCRHFTRAGAEYFGKLLDGVKEFKLER